MRATLALVFFILLTSGNAQCASFYIDPINGSDNNDGSSARPWKSLQYLFDEGLIESQEWDSLPQSDDSYLVDKNAGAPVKGGDTLYLRSGDYGELDIRSHYNRSRITIIAEQGHTPKFRNILVRSSANWRLEGLKVNASAFGFDGFSTLISLESHGWTGPVHSISVMRCNLSSITDSSHWSKDDWNSLAKNGIRVDGRSMKIAFNQLLNVNFGITVGGSHSMVERNVIENFAGDGLRGLGDYITFQYNTVKNCYDVNSNHDDGFQSWSVGENKKVGTGVVKGIVLRGNTIINWEDPEQPFRGTLQGIGCFDGMFDGWIVEGNIVRVDHWHGISLYGATNTIIRDNVVTDPNGKGNIGPPWIMLREHKNSTPSKNSRVSCNVSPKLIVSEDPSIIVEYNTLSETGGPKHQKCSSPSGMNPVLIPYLLNDKN